MAEADGLSIPQVVSLRVLFETIKRSFFNAAEEVFTSLSDFQKELAQHLAKITELNVEIARKNAEFAMKLCNFEKDICCIRDYYDIIIASTKTVVDYGSSQKIIPHIRELIEEKQYPEAEEEIKGFLHYLKKLIKRVQDDIDSLGQNCPSPSVVKRKIIQENAFTDVATKEKEGEVSTSQHKLFKLGMSTFIYTMAGAATSMIVASHVPVEGSEITKVMMSAGSEALSFYTGSVMEGLNSVMDASRISVELKRKVESSVTDVCRCLTGFFKQLTQFQVDIKTIETCISRLNIDIIDLEEDIDSDTSYGQTGSAWMYRSEILQKMFEHFAHLNTRVVEKQKTMADESEFGNIIARLERSVQLASLGTPV